MKKKAAKIILVFIMLLGIGFSISNFFSLDLDAVEKTGAWVYKNGVRECMGLGQDCDPFAFLPGG